MAFYIQTDIQHELKLVNVVQCLPDQQGIKYKVQKPRHGLARMAQQVNVLAMKTWSLQWKKSLTSESCHPTSTPLLISF